MKCNKKIYFLLILVLVMVLVPFNVLAEETTDPGTETPEIENPVVPGTPTEEGTTDPGTQTPEEEPSEPEQEENTGDNTGTVEPETPETEQDPETENNTETEENTEEKEENKKEETTKKEEEKTNTTNKRPNIDYSTTIIDNATKRVEISILGEDNQLLSGIKFQIQDKNGNIFYEEETTNEIFVFEEMELGTYYLVQVSTLDGYAENEDRVEFVVSKDSETVKVEVTNKLETKEDVRKEKDVFGMETPLLCSIAMFDIALCIGIIVYVRKSKNKDNNKK